MTDVVIQSQLQSPLVRTLQNIPTNSTHLYHGIPDNTPPNSRHKVTVNKHRGSIRNLNGEQAFKIPQNGHLTRIYFTYRMIGHIDGGNATVASDPDNPCSIADSIEYFELRTHNNVIERLYASSIPFLNSSIATSEQTLSTLLIGTAGYVALDAADNLFLEPNFSRGLITLGNETQEDGLEMQAKDYMINVPFSSLFYLKDNLQTRMMEDMEVVVKLKTGPAQSAVNARAPNFPTDNTHNLQMHCSFINFHENVENVIRNENYKPNVPASLLQNDQLYFKAKFVPGSRKTLSARQAVSKYSVDLTNDRVVTDIYIVPKVHDAGLTYDRVAGLSTQGEHFTLSAGGVVIKSGTKVEFDGIESLNYSTVTRQYQNEGIFPPRWSRCGSHIRLALNNTDEYLDGGISFASLSNPKLDIQVYHDTGVEGGFRVDGGAPITRHLHFDPDILEFDVILKYKVLLRIDGNTGKIQKSLES